MDSFRKSTIRDQVYHIIRSKILSQEFPFGSRLNINTLAARLHVSNSPIREALILLEKEGLLTIQPNVGAKVIRFTENSYQELNTAVCALLAATYGVCAKEGQTGHLSVLLRGCIEAQKECAEKNDAFCLTERAMAFDKSFFEVAGNRYLQNVYANMESIVYLQILDNYRRHGLEIGKTIREHEVIALAVERQDAQAVKDALERHYDKHVPSLA